MVKKFSETEEEFDQSTYSGRFNKFLSLIDPRLMFANEREVQEARLKIKNKSGTDEELWYNRRLLESATHPQTGELIPTAFRVSAFIPTNIPICAGMLFAAPTMFNNVFWQWMNQSYNAGFNYSNGNKGAIDKKDPSVTNDLLQSYAAATTISVSLCVGLNALLKRSKGLSPTVKSVAQISIPFLAVASAGVANVLLMRRKELHTGVPIYSPEGVFLGNSKKAAKVVLTKVAMTRVAMSTPILLLPPIMMKGILAVTALTPAMRKLCELCVLTGCLTFALPAAVGIFPRTLQIDVKDIEEEFTRKANFSYVVADKGL